MKPRTLLVLTVVVLVLGAFILFYEQDLGSTDERKEREGRLVPVEADEVTAVTFGQGDEAVRLERVDLETDETDDADEVSEPSSWRLAAPLEARAVAADIDAFLTRLDGLRREREIDGASRADLGLETPRAIFTLEVDDEPIVVRVGEELPLGGTVAVEIERDGDTTVVEASSFAGDLLDKVRRSAADWRDPLLFPGVRADVERIVLEGGGGRGDERLVLAREADAGEPGDLRLAEPIADAADDPALNALLSGLTSLEASSFLDADDRVDFEPVVFAEVTLRGVDEPFRLSVGPPETGAERLVRIDSSMGRDQQVRADVEFMLEALDRPIDAWRSLDLTTLQVFELDAASFEGPAVETATGAARLELERVEGLWRKTAGGETLDVDYTRATDVLYPLADARAVELTTASEGSASETSADAILRVQLRTADAVETLSILPAVDGRHPVRVDGRDAVLRLGAAVVDETLAALGAIDAPPEEVDASAGGFETLGLDEIDSVLGGLGGQPALEDTADGRDDTQEITP